MADRAPAPQGLDLQGASDLLQERSHRWARLAGQPDMPEVMGLLVRNAGMAGKVRRFIENEIAEQGGVGLDVPVRWGGPAGDRQPESA